MGITRKPIVEKTERRSRDAVTGELIVVPLDAVQLALEQIHRAIDVQMLKLMSEVDRDRLVSRVRELLDGMVRHT